LIVAFVGIALTPNMILIGYHELAHKEINDHYFINSTIKHIPFVVSYVESDLDLSVEGDLDKYTSSRHYHLLNEIVGYHSTGISFTIICGCVIIALAIVIGSDRP